MDWVINYGQFSHSFVQEKKGIDFFTLLWNVLVNFIVGIYLEEATRCVRFLSNESGV